MAISKDHQARLDQFLMEKVKNWTCTMCRNDKWEATEVARVELGGLVDQAAWDAPSLRLVALVCTNCGHVVFFNLGKPGVGLVR